MLLALFLVCYCERPQGARQSPISSLRAPSLVSLRAKRSNLVSLAQGRLRRSHRLYCHSELCAAISEPRPFRAGGISDVLHFVQDDTAGLLMTISWNRIR